MFQEGIWASGEAVESSALAEVIEADCGAPGVDWGVVDAGAAEEDDREGIWHINFSLRKHLASMWPSHEQKLHLGQLEALFCDFWEEEGEEDDGCNGDTFREYLGAAEDTVKAEVVEDKFAHMWFMLQSD